jgi:putative flippase GtrA
MTMTRDSAAEEAGLAVKFAAVGLIGFTIDALLLRGGLAVHLAPQWARLISLSLAMQVTFAVNRRFVFRCRGLAGLWSQWGRYMLTNGFGNFCSYWIFIGLGSLHGHVVSRPFVALPISAVCAYVINYAGVRLVVFGRGRIGRRRAARATRGAQPEGQLGTT